MATSGLWDSLIIFEVTSIVFVSWWNWFVCFPVYSKLRLGHSCYNFQFLAAKPRSVTQFRKNRVFPSYLLRQDRRIIQSPYFLRKPFNLYILSSGINNTLIISSLLGVIFSKCMIPNRYLQAILWNTEITSFVSLVVDRNSSYISTTKVLWCCLLVTHR